MSNYRNQLESFLKGLDVKVERVLDIGGQENPVIKRVHSWDVQSYEILDLPHYDINEVNDRKDHADVVFCLEVMEYVFDPRTAVWNIARLMGKNGMLYITFQFIYPVHEPKKMDALRYTCDGSARLLAEAGLKIIEIVPRTMTDGGFALWKEFMRVEGMHSSKHSRHDFLGWIFIAQKC